MIQVIHTSFPSLGRQARNAAGAAGRVVAAVAMGAPVMVSDQVRAERLAQCGECPHHSGGRCALCGCCLGGSVLDKAMLATERCPDSPSKWDRVIHRP